MKDTEKYIAPDVEFVSLEITDEITGVTVSKVDDPTHDAMIDWS